MTTVIVKPGACSLKTTIKTVSRDMQTVNIEIDSECPYVKEMEKYLKEVNGIEECCSKVGQGRIYKTASKYCRHTSCPVPSALIKAVEVACGLALPKDVGFVFAKEALQ